MSDESQRNIQKRFAYSMVGSQLGCWALPLIVKDGVELPEAAAA